MIEFEELIPYAPELQQEIALVQQELNALDEKLKPIEKEWAFLLENFFQKKLNISFIKLVINHLEKGDEPTITICKLCGQEVEQQMEPITKKIRKARKVDDKDSKELWEKYERISSKSKSEIKKNIGQEKLEQIFRKSDEKLKKAVLAELKSFLEKSSESTQQDSKSQSNQPKTTNYTPWIVSGVIGGGLTIGLVIILRKKRTNARN